MDTSGDSGNISYSFLPTGDTCDNCNSTNNVQRFDGKDLCKSCRNQWAEIR